MSIGARIPTAEIYSCQREAGSVGPTKPRNGPSPAVSSCTAHTGSDSYALRPPCMARYCLGLMASMILKTLHPTP